jgi:uncharacterized protein YjbI with pentapeptide repeats
LARIIITAFIASLSAFVVYADDECTVVNGIAIHRNSWQNQWYSRIMNMSVFQSMQVRRMAECGADDIATKDIENAVYDGETWVGCYFSDVCFRHCSFKGTKITLTVFAGNSLFSGDCDFSDAEFENVHGLGLTATQLKTTLSYKKKVLRGIHFESGLYPENNDFSGVDFTGFDFTGSTQIDVKKKGCNFTNAVVNRCILGDFSREQIMQTRDYRNKAMIGVHFGYTDISGMDFSGFNLTGCIFDASSLPKEEGFSRINFTDAIITNCYFDFPLLFTTIEGVCAGRERPPTLTLAQIKSTWNYKTGNMSGVMLPKYIQDELDKEKKEKETNK